MTNNTKSILSLLPLLLLAASAAAAEPPKNVVLILADDLGWADTTLYGETSKSGHSRQVLRARCDVLENTPCPHCRDHTEPVISDRWSTEIAIDVFR